MGSFIANKDYRLYNFVSNFGGNIRLTLDSSQEEKLEALKKIKENIESTPWPISDEHKGEFNSLFDRRNILQADQQKELSAAQAPQLAYACSDVTLLHIPSCVKNLKRIKELARPLNWGTAIYAWNEVYNKPIYAKVFKKIALQILEHIETDTAPKERFFDDIKAAFLTETRDKKQAEEFAWNTMAVLSSAGAHVKGTSYYFFGHGVPELDHLLHVLANGSLYLDRLTAPQGHLYTFPREVDNICDYGKNYHFWMSAYLAHELVKEYGDKDAAAFATFTADKGYQIASKTYSRKPDKAFKEATFSNNKNNMRLDLAFAAAGALYGAHSLDSKQPELTRDNINRGIRDEFDGAEPISANYGFDIGNSSVGGIIGNLKTYHDWKKSINPDAAFKYYEQVIQSQ